MSPSENQDTETLFFKNYPTGTCSGILCATQSLAVPTENRTASPFDVQTTASLTQFVAELFKHLSDKNQGILITAQRDTKILFFNPRSECTFEEASVEQCLNSAFQAKWSHSTLPENPPGVSIVIPAYNYSHFLPEALDSLLAQDYPKFEIIIIDDGSTDDTAKVASSYGSSVRYVYQDNSGLPASRNSGIRKAKYDLLSFVDADDLWLPGTLRAMVATSLNEANECPLVAAGCFVMDGETRITPKSSYFKHKSGKVTQEDILLKNRFHASGNLCRKSDLIASGLFEDTMRSSEDRDTWVRLSSKKDLFMIEECRSMYRVHGNNMSQNTERMKKHMRMVFNNAKRRSGSERTALFWIKIRSFYLYQASCMYYDAGQKRLAIRDLMASLLLWPSFPNSGELSEPPFFRLRSLIRYIVR